MFDVKHGIVAFNLFPLPTEFVNKEDLFEISVFKVCYGEPKEKRRERKKKKKHIEGTCLLSRTSVHKYCIRFAI
jgi:hypothetical protein